MLQNRFSLFPNSDSIWGSNLLRGGLLKSGAEKPKKNQGVFLWVFLWRKQIARWQTWFSETRLSLHYDILASCNRLLLHYDLPDPNPIIGTQRYPDVRYFGPEPRRLRFRLRFRVRVRLRLLVRSRLRFRLRFRLRLFSRYRLRLRFRLRVRLRFRLHLRFRLR